MSYGIDIVMPPISTNDKEAWKDLNSLRELEGTPTSVFRTLHERLTARFPCICDLPDDQVDDGVWSDGPLWNDFGHRVAMLGMVYSAVEHALPFVVETSLALGLAVFDGQEGIIHRPGGLMGVRLTSESRPVRYGPELQQVLDSVDAMTPRGGPSYLVLERSNGNYAQTAGGDGSFTAEWREVSGNSFRHWVAGLPGQSVTKSIKIKTNGATVIVKENEGLGATDVKAILTAFAKQTARPADYLWRETTDQFA